MTCCFSTIRKKEKEKVNMRKLKLYKSSKNFKKSKIAQPTKITPHFSHFI